MLQNIDAVTSDDLIRELTPEAFKYFTETKLSDDWSTFDKLSSTKFVRLGVGKTARIILGSTIEYGPLSEELKPTRRYIFHRDLRRYGFTRHELSEKDRQAMHNAIGARKPLSGDGLMLDAGRAMLLITNEGTPLVHFGGYSFEFGNADEAGRMETADVARAILGDGFEVTANLT